MYQPLTTEQFFSKKTKYLLFIIKLYIKNAVLKLTLTFQGKGHLTMLKKKHFLFKNPSLLNKNMVA